MTDGRTVAAIIVAAGTSSRMGFDKLLHPIEGVPVLRRAVAVLDACRYVDQLVVVAGAQREAVAEMLRTHPPEKPLKIVPGGATRAASVAAGVGACGEAALVAIHDGARPFASQALVERVIEAAAQAGAAAPALAVRDTIKREANGFVEATVPRQGLVAVQTPQVFDRAAYAKALAAIAETEYAHITDDCMVMERAGKAVELVAGEESNIKITTPGDLAGLERQNAKRGFSIGHGYDVHRLVPGRRLVLGGVEIPHETGLLGHSDADVLLHAVMDALLGAAALGDFGRHFPDNDPAYAGADSLRLLEAVAALLRREGWQAGNVDATVVCQAPRLARHIPAMRRNIATVLGLGENTVNVKATTEEGLGFTGAGQGIAAHAVALLHAV